MNRIVILLLIGAALMRAWDLRTIERIESLCVYGVQYRA